MSDLKTKKLTWDLDDVLLELGIGRYQITNFILIGLLLMFSNISPLSFTLTASDLQYRCSVPACDGPDTHYKPSWLINAFHIMCEDQKWELSLVGTINTAGQYVGICIFGIISDKFGRKFVALLCTLVSTVFGLLRGFSSGYLMFITFEFLDSLFSSGIYGAAFILGLELVTPRWRPAASTMVGTFYPFGAILMGIVSWWVQDWRKMIIICYAPGLLFLFYCWLIPESVRWLETNGRHQEAVKIIKNISNTNKKSLSDGTLENIKYSGKNDGDEILLTSLFFKFKCLGTPGIMEFPDATPQFATTFVYYGLSINSVELIGNKHLNFILVNLVEVPSFITSGIIIGKYPRKPSQCTTVILSGLGCIACQFIPPDMEYLQIILYLASKCMITISFIILYVYSAEMFPTELRLSLFGLSSILGRTGSIFAPQTVLLQQYVGRHAPVLLFGATSLLAGVVSTFFSETYCKKMPDTVNEVKEKNHI